MMDKWNWPNGDEIQELAEVKEEAESFIRQFYDETKRAKGEADKRVAVVLKSIEKDGTYKHTFEELEFGCR